jgi:tetratricopeptide (TPR) repeat protein
MKFLFCSIIALSISFACLAQSSSNKFEKDLDFLFYLGQNGQHTDFDYYGEKLLTQDSLNKSQKDSLNFILGVINFKLQHYDKSLRFLPKVSDESLFYPKSNFFSGICYVENKDYRTAFSHLQKARLNQYDDLLQQLKTFELAGISLLERNYQAYDSLNATFSTSNAMLNNEYQLLQKNYNELKTLKRKSPFVAGSLSAIVPGLGLAYAGNNGQALAAFIRVVALGALSAENYIKLGPKNAQFITAASLFTFFYVGNIWGSVLCVQLIKNEKIKEIDHNIVVGLRIPVDNLFK